MPAFTFDPSLLSFSQWIHNLSYGIKDWNEAEHPRASDGKFTSGGGSSQPSPKPTSSPKTEFSRSSGFAPPIQSTTQRVGSSIGSAFKAVGAKIHSTKAAIFEKLPTPVKEAIGAYHALEHTLEKPYKAAQNLALAVARERGLSDKHVDRVARILGWSDTIKRWTSNVPIAHHILEHVAHAGGPLSFIGAKIGFYTPVASLAYLASHLTREAVSGKNPVALLTRARERIVRVKASKQSSIGDTGHAGHY